MVWNKTQMAKKVLEMIPNGSCINLGIGLPTLVAETARKEQNLVIHSENGVLGVRGRPKVSNYSPTLINAGKETISIQKGASFFDSSLSFGMIRGGHIDFSILGGMQVDVSGNLANWMIPGKKITGMGGAMDLVNGSKSIVIMMNHFSKEGETKLVKECSLPLTGKNVVNFIVTELGIFSIHNYKFQIIELSNKTSVEDLRLNKDILYID